MARPSKKSKSPSAPRESPQPQLAPRTSEFVNNDDDLSSDDNSSLPSRSSNFDNATRSAHRPLSMDNASQDEVHSEEELDELDSQTSDKSMPMPEEEEDDDEDDDDEDDDDEDDDDEDDDDEDDDDEDRDRQLNTIEDTASSGSLSSDDGPVHSKQRLRKRKMRVPTPVPAVKNKKSRKSLRSRDSTTPDSDQDTAEESPDRESSVYQPSEIFTSLPPEIRQMEEQVQKLLRIANEAGVDKQRHQRFQQLWQRDDTQEPVESLFIGDDLTPNMIVEADKFEEDIGSDQSDTHPDDEKAALAQDALAWGEDQNEIWENYRRVVHPPTAHSCRPNSITRERDHDPVENAGESDERLVKQVFKEIEQGGPIYTAWSDGVPEHELKHSVREMVYQERNIHRSVNYNHRYDWMHPLAPLRLQNEWIQDVVNKLQSRFESFKFFNLTGAHSPQCTNQHHDGDESRMICIECDTDHQWKQSYSKMSKKFLAIIKRIKDLTKKRLQLNMASSEPRCYWCGQATTGCNTKVMDELLRYARVDIEGVGPLPSVYEYDHEQNPLCLHCAAEMSSLLKEKRRFQSFYELTAVNMPRSCNNCGIRDSLRFVPGVDRMGEACSTCYTHKEQNGLDPDSPVIESGRAQEFLDGILESMDGNAIHWDKVANSSKANPGFLYSAQGLNSQWICSIKGPSTPAMTTYILLQHNHLTRRSQDWEFYTCNASSPSQAALYFARYTALYKKRPMTYLYIRALETWNTPDLQEDDWEDRSSGLQTFTQLRNRIRKSVLSKANATDNGAQERSSESNPVQATDWCQDELTPEELESARELAEDREQANLRIGPLPIRLVRPEEWAFEQWIKRLEEAYAEYEGLPYPIQSLVEGKDILFEVNYLQETFWVVYQYLLHMLPARYPEGGGMRKNRIRSIALFILPEIIRQMEDVTGKMMLMNDFAQLRPLESRHRLMPDWARENAREAARGLAQDEGFLRLYARALAKEKEAIKDPSSDEFQKKVEQVQETILRHGHSPRTTEDCAKLVSRWANMSTSLEEREDRAIPNHARLKEGKDLETWAKRFPELALLRPSQFRQLVGERPAWTDAEDAERRQFLADLVAKERAQVRLQGPAAAGTTRVYFEEVMYEGERPMFSEREELPSAEVDHQMPTGQFPVYLLPLEYQVHVFQSALCTETRTASVRLVRTERYKRQGDVMQGGGPVQVPKIINRNNTRGFYRESNRIGPDRAPTLTRGIDRLSRDEVFQVPELVFRCKDPKLSDDDSAGIEVWRRQNLKEWHSKGYIDVDTLYKVVQHRRKVSRDIKKPNTKGLDKSVVRKDADIQEPLAESARESGPAGPKRRTRLHNSEMRIGRQIKADAKLRQKHRLFSNKELKKMGKTLATEMMEDEVLDEYNHQVFVVRAQKRLSEAGTMEQIEDRRQELVQELDYDLEDQLGDAELDKGVVLLLEKQLEAEQRALGLDDADQESSRQVQKTASSASRAIRSQRARDLARFKASRKWKVEVAKQLCDKDQAPDWIIEDGSS